jgi:hypothetical protein
MSPEACMKTVLITITALALLVIATSFAGEEDPKPAPKSALVVGVFDSRAIAVAYAASSFHEKYLEGVRARAAGAKAKGDAKKLAEINRDMEQRQRDFHLMAFGTDSVKELLEPVKGKLPAVAKAAGVDLIVSQWEVAFRNPDTKVVDLTSALVSLYNPSEKTLGYVRDLKDKAPVPRDTLLKMKGQ